MSRLGQGCCSEFQMSLCSLLLEYGLSDGSNLHRHPGLESTMSCKGIPCLQSCIGQGSFPVMLCNRNVLLSWRESHFYMSASIHVLHTCHTESAVAHLLNSMTTAAAQPYKQAYFAGPRAFRNPVLAGIQVPLRSLAQNVPVTQQCAGQLR